MEDGIVQRIAISSANYAMTATLLDTRKDIARISYRKEELEYDNQA